MLIILWMEPRPSWGAHKKLFSYYISNALEFHNGSHQEWQVKTFEEIFIELWAYIMQLYYLLLVYPVIFLLFLCLMIVLCGDLGITRVRPRPSIIQPMMLAWNMLITWTFFMCEKMIGCGAAELILWNYSEFSTNQRTPSALNSVTKTQLALRK